MTLRRNLTETAGLLAATVHLSRREALKLVISNLTEPCLR
jgi:hypothetical protein